MILVIQQKIVSLFMSLATNEVKIAQCKCCRSAIIVTSSPESELPLIRLVTLRHLFAIIYLANALYPNTTTKIKATIPYFVNYSKFAK